MPQATILRGVRVADADSPLDGATLDLGIVGGRIRTRELSAADLAGADVLDLDARGHYVSPGWVDFGCGVGEPGHEQRETVATLLDAAGAGGYTRVVAQPSADPPLDNAGAYRAFLALGAAHPVTLDAIARLATRDGALTEMGELHEAGARFFGEGLGPVDDSKLLQLALLYTQPFAAGVVATPGDARLRGGGLVHEGATSTRMGVPGLPVTEEIIGLQRDLRLQAYRGGRLHVQAVSSAAALAALRERAKGVTVGVAALNLLATVADVADYDATLKVMPPLRGEADRAALIAGLRSGEVDVLASNHRPRTVEETELEFAYALFGAATIEDAYGIAATGVGDGLLAADYLGRRNRAAIGLPAATIAEGAEAELTVFDPAEEYTVPARGVTLAANRPLVGRRLRGRAVGIFSRGQWRARDTFGS